MNKLLLIIAYLLFIHSYVWAIENTPNLPDHTDNINYSFGYQLGRELATAGVEMRPEALFQALYTALASDQPELTREEMATIIRNAAEKKQ